MPVPGTGTGLVARRNDTRRKLELSFRGGKHADQPPRYVDTLELEMRAEAELGAIKPGIPFHFLHFHQSLTQRVHG
jgi:hypothetical protein